MQKLCKETGVEVPQHRRVLVPVFLKVIEVYGGLSTPTILDVGCGGLRKEFKAVFGERYKGLDLPSCPYPKDFEGDAEDLSRFGDDEFDVVTAFSVLEHLHNPMIGLSEMLRVSRHTVILTTDLTRTDQDRDDSHLYCWTPKVFKQFLERVAQGKKVKVWTEINILFGAIYK